MSDSLKFQLLDYVRCTNSNLLAFDQVGRIVGRVVNSVAPYKVEFGGGKVQRLTEHELTLADPDVHTVLDQMDAESRVVTVGADTDNSFTVRITDPEHPAFKDITEQEIDGDYVRGLAAAEFGTPCLTAEQWEAAIKPDPDTRGMVLPNRRAKTLRTAESLINGDRAAAYGHPSENFGRIASLWNAQFGAKLAEPFTAEDVALALVHLKMSRLANTPGHEDSLIDACGYLALASEIANPDV